MDFTKIKISCGIGIRAFDLLFVQRHSQFDTKLLLALPKIFF